MTPARKLLDLMLPLPEPAGDIRAQLAAVMSLEHPKRACYVVPEDAHQIPLVLAVSIVARPEGVLVTHNLQAEAVFRTSTPDITTDEFDRMMAWILDYPEAKPDIVPACGGRPVANARAVQARSAEGYVITEAFCSPAGLEATQAALQTHVPPGGSLCVLTPIEAIGRRLVLREAGE